MQLATWNINSLTVRLPQVLEWLAANPVDVLALQEIKMTDDKFPAAAFADADLELNAGTAVVALGVLDIGCGEVDSLNAANVGVQSKRRRKASGSAPNVEYTFSILDAGKLDELWRKSAAPSSHLQFVPVAIRR